MSEGEKMSEEIEALKEIANQLKGIRILGIWGLIQLGIMILVLIAEKRGLFEEKRK